MCTFIKEKDVIELTDSISKKCINQDIEFIIQALTFVNAYMLSQFITSTDDLKKECENIKKNTITLFRLYQSINMLNKMKKDNLS